MRFMGVCLAAAIATAAPLYTVREFGFAGARGAFALAISGTGTAAGEATAADLTRMAIAGPGALALSATAADVNSAGLAVGTTWTDQGPRATVWDNGATRLLDIWNSYGNGMNERGDIAGSGVHAGRKSAFLTSGDATTFIDTGIDSSAYDVSNRGQVVGYAQQTGGEFRAFSWFAGGAPEYLGTLGGRHSYAQAVNDSGSVVGSSTNRNGYLNAFLYSGGMVNLGTLGGTTSAAYDINSAGSVVGYSTDQAGQSRAFLWRDGVLVDLNNTVDLAFGWILEAAYGINDRGQIVGAATKDGRSTGFILDPVSLSTALTQRVQFEAVQYDESLQPIPEPGTWVMAAVGILVLVVVRTVRPANR